MLYDPSLAWMLLIGPLCGSWRQVLLAAAAYSLWLAFGVRDIGDATSWWGVALLLIAGFLLGGFAGLFAYYVRRTTIRLPWDRPLHPIEGKGPDPY